MAFRWPADDDPLLVLLNLLSLHKKEKKENCLVNTFWIPAFVIVLSQNGVLYNKMFTKMISFLSYSWNRERAWGLL